jgi:hypothetical protein
VLSKVLLQHVDTPVIYDQACYALCFVELPERASKLVPTVLQLLRDRPVSAGTLIDVYMFLSELSSEDRVSQPRRRSTYSCR